MSISKSGSRAAVLGLAALQAAVITVNPVSIRPYGSLSALLSKDSPWRVFRSDDPVLTSIRADRLLFTKGETCQMWVHSLAEDRQGIVRLASSKPDPREWPKGWGGWAPLEKGEREAIEKCDGFPCAVKMNETEAERMKSSPKTARLETFLGIVSARASAYAKSGQRSSYEFPGGISEPWSLLEARGLKSDLPRPSQPELGLRRMDFGDSRARPIRQVLDRRVAVSSDGMEASVWVRDAYTDHYFDSWGEWANLRCFPEKRYVEVVFAMSLELDLLKEHDLISMLARGSMRNSVRQLSIKYLDRWSHGVQSMTEAQAKTSAATSSGTP